MGPQICTSEGCLVTARNTVNIIPLQRDSWPQHRTEAALDLDSFQAL